MQDITTDAPKKISKLQYQEAIPDCCKLRTTEEHEMKLMLCWGLLSSIRGNYKLKCGCCEHNKEINNA